MPTYNIVVFAGDHCGPEVTAEALKVKLSPTLFPPLSPCASTDLREQVLRVLEKHRKEIKFNFQEHLLGGVSTKTIGWGDKVKEGWGKKGYCVADY